MGLSDTSGTAYPQGDMRDIRKGHSLSTQPNKIAGSADVYGHPLVDSNPGQEHNVQTGSHLPVYDTSDGTSQPHPSDEAVLEMLVEDQRLGYRG